MPTLEEVMRDALRRRTPTADPSDVFEQLTGRRRRRSLTRKVGTIGLVIAVLGGTVGAFALLGNAFGTKPQPLGPSTSNGALVVSLANGDGFSLYVLPPGRQDLAPGPSTSAAGRDSMQLLTGSGTVQDRQPAISPDGSTVAFVRRASKNAPTALWTIGMDGSRAHAIVPASVDVADPSWSPDGRWIAFTGVVTDVRALFLVHPDGSAMHVLPFTPASSVSSPAWSPDGRQLVVSATPYTNNVGADRTADLWIIGVDGSDLRNLTSTPDVSETEPAYSPGDTHIAFVTPDGIEQMPADGGSPEILVPASGLAEDRPPTQPGWSPDGRYLAFEFGPTAPLPPVVYVLPEGSSTAFPLAWGWDFAWQPLPANEAIPSITTQPNLGLGYDVCRVSSMPIITADGPGAAYVFSKRGANGCPKRADGYVGVDVNGDGGVDATYGPLGDCFLRCEAFGSPDVNGDGVSEVAVSTEGADGYGVSLFLVPTSPVSIHAIRVEDPQNLAHVLDPLQFAWVDVATHFSGARCGTSQDGRAALILDAGDKRSATADVQSTSLVLDGSTATVVDVSHATMPMADAPSPDHEFCGTPLYNSAANFPEGPHRVGEDIGLSFPVCHLSSLDGVDLGNGASRVWRGAKVTLDGRCPNEGAALIVAADVDGDGLADTWAPLQDCSYCEPDPVAAADLNGDGIDEVIVREVPFTVPSYRVLTLSAGALSPVLVAGSGHPEAGFIDGKPAVLSAGGDAGISDHIACDGWPSNAVLTQFNTDTPIDGARTTIHVSRLVMEGSSFRVVGSRDYTQPATTALPFGTQPDVCGVPWGP